MTQIIFYTKDTLDILRHTDVDVLKSNFIWTEANASDTDLEAFHVNQWWHKLVEQ